MYIVSCIFFFKDVFIRIAQKLHVRVKTFITRFRVKVYAPGPVFVQVCSNFMPMNGEATCVCDLNFNKFLSNLCISIYMSFKNNFQKRRWKIYSNISEEVHTWHWLQMIIHYWCPSKMSFLRFGRLTCFIYMNIETFSRKSSRMREKKNVFSAGAESANFMTPSGEQIKGYIVFFAILLSL